MNIAYLSAAAVAIVSGFTHFFVGERAILSRLSTDALLNGSWPITRRSV